MWKSISFHCPYRLRFLKGMVFMFSYFNIPYTLRSCSLCHGIFCKVNNKGYVCSRSIMRMIRKAWVIYNWTELLGITAHDGSGRQCSSIWCGSETSQHEVVLSYEWNPKEMKLLRCILVANVIYEDNKWWHCVSDKYCTRYHKHIIHAYEVYYWLPVVRWIQMSLVLPATLSRCTIQTLYTVKN